MVSDTMYTLNKWIAFFARANGSCLLIVKDDLRMVYVTSSDPYGPGCKRDDRKPMGHLARVKHQTIRLTRRFYKRNQTLVRKPIVAVPLLSLKNLRWGRGFFVH